MNIVVPMSDAKISSRAEDVLVTYSLGSCIGVSLYDPMVGVAGMLHFQLPTSAGSSERAAEKPLMYADAGMKWLMEHMVQRGAERRRMRVHLAGGANMLNANGLYDIGRRNHASVRKILWQNQMLIKAEHVGGSTPRTMQLNVADGAVVIKINNKCIEI